MKTAAVLGLGLILLSTGCGERPRDASPASPTPSPEITASLSPVPLRARLRSGGPSFRRYEVVADVTLRNTTPAPMRVTRLQLTAVHSDGVGDTRTVAMDAALAPRSALSRTLVELVDVPSGAVFLAWRLHVSAVADNDEQQAVAVGPVETPVVVEGGQAPGIAGPDATVIAAGDIALCSADYHEATAKVIDGIAGTVLTLGDHVYPSGTTEQFEGCYGRSWGRHRSRTRPAPGNHDWDAASGSPYFAYFGANAGPPGLGYYSYDLGAWHVVVLNSNIAVGAGSAQLDWLRRDLAASPATCTLTYWHHPLFSSGPNGNTSSMAAAWKVLDDAEADLVLSSHDHMYERFAPQDATARPDPRGLRSFVVGTGGGALYGLRTLQPNSEVRNHNTYGALKVVLRAGSYDWEFVPISGQSFRDTGSAQCVTP